MKGRKSARGSVQSCPVQDPNVVRVQIETLCQERPQLTAGARVAEGLTKLHYAAPFVAEARALRLAVDGDKVRVVLGSHGWRLVAQGRYRPIDVPQSHCFHVYRLCHYS